MSEPRCPLCDHEKVFNILSGRCDNKACGLPQSNWPAVQALKDELEGFKLELADRNAGLRLKDKQISALKDRIAELTQENVEDRRSAQREHDRLKAELAAVKEQATRLRRYWMSEMGHESEEIDDHCADEWAIVLSDEVDNVVALSEIRRLNALAQAEPPVEPRGCPMPGDGEPVTEEWIKSIARLNRIDGYSRFYVIDKLSTSFFIEFPCDVEGCGMKLVELGGQDQVIWIESNLETRGFVRRLCAALGVELGGN